MITFCQMTQNRLHETRHCVEKYLPYVDKVVIVDGGSVDDTIFYMRNWAIDEPKIEFHLCPWKDNFSYQRNNYLKHVPDNTWALVSDPDEVFDLDLLQALPELVKAADKRRKDAIGFQCRSVSMRGSHRFVENLDKYWKRLLFKKYPSTKYTGNPHEHLSGHPLRIMDTTFIYEHIKQDNVIWHRGARNLFCGGGGPNLGSRNQRWIDLRKVCDSLALSDWHNFEKYLIRGNIDERIKDWMYENKEIDGFDGASEHREMWKLYFEIYHPEEKRPS